MNELAREALLPRATLDSDYNARASVSPQSFDHEMRRYRALSDSARAEAASFLDVVYDDESGQTLDIFGAGDDSSQPRPVFLFIHGGYWRALSKRDSAFMATMLARHGIATAVVDYRLAPTVSLSEIVREVRAATAFLWRNANRFGIDPERIFAGGSSAGGHLTGTLLSGGWHAGFAVPENVIKGALPVSGLFHLAPIASCFPQEWLSLTPAEIEALSPAANLPRSGCPIVMAFADSEPAGFKRQSQAYERLWREAGFDATLLEIAGRNHFDIILDLADEDSALARALLQIVKSG